MEREICREPVAALKAAREKIADGTKCTRSTSETSDIETAYRIPVQQPVLISPEPLPRRPQPRTRPGKEGSTREG